jgi:methylenetetrahydrofolate dehydrogenase (NADP+) / methenyltetrahydrofolate cyclohydrolase
MAARLIDGTAHARAVRQEVAERVARLAEGGTRPGLATILIGDDPASRVYVASKVRACEQAGMVSRSFTLADDVSREELYGLIDGLNADPDVHGILVQLPLPRHLDYKAVLNRLRPSKDVDGFHPLNAGRAFVADPRAIVPATPGGIMELIRREEIPTRGRHVVIVGRSLIVSKPLASLLMAPGPDASVTLVHRHTPDISIFTRLADILVVAVGKPGLITREMVKPGAVVFDVGVTRRDAPGSEKGYEVVGDVDFEEVAEVAAAITPVPGGVGPMTIAMLLHNTVTAAERALRGERQPR